MKNSVIVKHDLSDEVYQTLSSAPELGVDCEMMGLNVFRDRLCLVQIGAEEGPFYLIQIDETAGAPNLKKLMENPAIVKIFHFARMDGLFLKKRLGIGIKNIYCTKIASKIARTYTDRHGLKELVRELLSETMDKTWQSSYWGADELTNAQADYAASDIKYLFRLKKILSEMLVREKREHLIQGLFDFLPHRIELDIYGYEDIFDHK